MKKIFFFISFTLLIFLSLAFTTKVKNTFSLFGKMIILDPGHGGIDPGSTYKDEYEKNYNLEFSRYLKEELENRGATVIMTRNGDYDLSSPSANKRKKSDFDNRIKLINENKPDIYLSLHMNYLQDSKYYGSQCFYSIKNKNNIRIAELIQKHLNNYFNSQKPYRQISNDKYMYSKINTPGILIEYGFLSNQRDRKNLKQDNYKRKLSQIIANGIEEYFT